jgi:hypothetical protein
VVVPDLAAIVRGYLDHRPGPIDSEEEPGSDLLMKRLSLRPSDAPRRRGLLAWYRRRTDLDSHKWMYDAEGLAYLFRQAGFSDARPLGHLDSAIPRSALAVVEYAERVENGAGICVEARR